MIIGLTGKNASGKGEVARIFRDGGFEEFSLSDEIRASLEDRGMETTRNNLIEEGRRLRNDEGLDSLAKRVVYRFSSGLNQVVDSIRNPAEVTFLRTLDNFFLLAVDAPIDTRFERLRQRNRPGDPTDIDGFVQAEARELESGDPAAQQLIETIALADYHIDNSTTIEDLTAQVKTIFRQAAGRLIRPSWDEYFMTIAEVVSSRSNCVKRHVAAVVVRDNRIISTGYNGTPRGTPNCNEGGCERCLSLAPSGSGLGECVCSHAEENAIVQAAYHGVSLKGSKIYSTFMPCILCTKMIINAGIAEVVYGADYPLPESARSLFHDAGVVARKFTLPPKRRT